MSKKETNKANNEETILNQEQDVKKTEEQVSGKIPTPPMKRFSCRPRWPRWKPK
jgi:hypothetical protein